MAKRGNEPTAVNGDAVARYEFFGIRYRQEELTIGEDLTVAPLIAPLLGFEAKTFAEWYAGALELLRTTDGFYRLFAVILKPDERTLWARWRNTFNAYRAGIALRPWQSGRPLTLMLKGSQVAEVLGDFFLFNSGWLTILPISAPQSESTISDTNGNS